MIARRAFLAGAAAFAAAPAVAQPVRKVSTALVLAADVSASINDERYHLQRKGYADTFADERVIRAITDTEEGCIGVCYLEWSTAQRVLVPWTLVRTVADGERIAGILDTAPRPFSDMTHIAAAIDFAATQMALCPFLANQRVIDVSGDGIDNGPGSVTEARDRAVAAGSRINGLPITENYSAGSGDPPSLETYYEENVKGGPNAFVIAARDFETFGAALVSKLRREIA